MESATPGVAPIGATEKKPLPALFRMWNFFRVHPGIYGSVAQAVCYTIAGAMDAEGKTKLLKDTIAKRVGISPRTVGRALRTIAASELPILAITHRPNRCSEFALVNDPAAFAAARHRASRPAAPQAFDPDARERCATGRRNREAACDHRPRCTDAFKCWQLHVDAIKDQLAARTFRKCDRCGEMHLGSEGCRPAPNF
jgi:hypothetical protein